MTDAMTTRATPADLLPLRAEGTGITRTEEADAPRMEVTSVRSPPLLPREPRRGTTLDTADTAVACPPA